MRKALPVFAGIVTLVTGFVTAFADNHEGGADVERLKSYYVKEGVNLGAYNKVLVDSLKVTDARVIVPPWYQGDDKWPKKWQLTSRDTEFLRQSYREAMLQAIQAEGGYEVVEEPAEDTLILDMEIITLMPYARKGEKVEVRGFGELRAQATLRDGMTSELLGIFEGVQHVGSEYQQNSRLNAENSLRALFEVWGARMRQVMDESRD
jgi:hypothetical protein